jgi:hypothetical protein
MSRYGAIVLCLVIFHAPDGSSVSVEKQHIAAIRPITEAIKEHLAPGTKSLLYVGAHKIGITETLEEAETMLEGCEQ